VGDLGGGSPPAGAGVLDHAHRTGLCQWWSVVEPERCGDSGKIWLVQARLRDLPLHPSTHVRRATPTYARCRC
jgi:hypothetical protein